MIGQLIGSLTGLATSIIDGKTQIKLTEAEIKKSSLQVRLIGTLKL